ncbi:MAG: sulfite exporter TauE/SafE family protein [Comamonadaceae bacterium]|nr:sulfite exporter TauE/SafE family protein [Comamonadaceae bacterium]
MSPSSSSACSAAPTASACAAASSARSRVQTPGSRPRWPLHLAYNARAHRRRYAAAGALAGAVGGASLRAGRAAAGAAGALRAGQPDAGRARASTSPARTRALAFTERVGQELWRRIQPLTRRFLPARSVAQALPLGLLWGLLPCGMVYSVLATALVAGSALRGAALMLAFGLGTLPNLLLAGALLVTTARASSRQRAVRLVSGVLVLAFGVYGLMNAAHLGGRLWQGVFGQT